MLCILDSLLLCAFAYKTYNTVFMFEIYYPQSNTGSKASLALLHMTTFTLQSSNQELQEKESIMCSGIYFQYD